MKLVVGLGNPGPKYAGTRHNIGFDVVDRLAARWNVSLRTEKFHAWFGDGDLRGVRAALLKPTTYMNRSGQAVVGALRFYQATAADLVVISDDLALPLGRLRMRGGGSSGCHLGLQDIIERLGTDQWCRLRLGIGAAVGRAADYVLDRFDPPEAELVVRVVDRAADAIECWLEHGPDTAMTRYNGDVLP
ncbi:MAG: aminoacyl-tRNA hydrolase [Planctomycetes bacterium]|nr:aminoacyl-tRNA hydrolase [Planctomycetota bacterium]